MSIDMTTVGTTPGIGLAGTDMDPLSPTDTYMNESATAIEPGAPVALGTTTQAGGFAQYCKPVAADTDNIIGVTVRRALVSTNGTTVAYAQYDSVPVKKAGKVAVLAAEAVRAGDEVVVLTATPGTFASSKGGVVGTGRVAMKGWKWVTTTGAAAIGIIEGFDTHTGRTTT
jgi:hypothetical protein